MREDDESDFQMGARGADEDDDYLMLDNDEEFGYGVLVEEGYQGEINYKN